jgi:ATP-dependent RNA helicase DHX8/PRP22
VDGVKYVVDSGFVKQMTYDPGSGMDALVVTPISRSAATQRSGRAGRTSAGKCYRLFSRAYHDETMEEETIPEIQRTSLINTVLSLKKIGIRDIIHFDFMDPPSQETVVNAMKQLFLLGALTADGDITATGELMSLFPLAPNLSRVMVASLDYGCSEEMLTIVAMLSAEDIFVTPHNKADIQKASKARESFHQLGGDHFTLLHIYDLWEASEFSTGWAKENFLHHRHLKTVRSIRKQLLDIMEKNKLKLKSCRDGDDRPDLKAILKTLSQGFFSHSKQT